VAEAQQDELFLKAWADALQEQLTQQPLVPAFELVASRLELSAGAAIIHFEDPSGAMTALRQKVEMAAADQELAALDQQLGGAVQRYFVPNIVHSSYARFIRPVDAQRGEEMQAAFQELASKFKPFSITVSVLNLINECSAYMHQSREDGNYREYSLARV
jgi:hypothetical protein